MSKVSYYYVKKGKLQRKKHRDFHLRKNQKVHRCVYKNITNKIAGETQTKLLIAVTSGVWDWSWLKVMTIQGTCP